VFPVVWYSAVLSSSFVGPNIFLNNIISNTCKLCKFRGFHGDKNSHCNLLDYDTCCVVGQYRRSNSEVGGRICPQWYPPTWLHGVMTQKTVVRSQFCAWPSDSAQQQPCRFLLERSSIRLSVRTSVTIEVLRDLPQLLQVYSGVVPRFRYIRFRPNLSQFNNYIVGPANQDGCIILRVGNLADEKFYAFNEVSRMKFLGTVVHRLTELPPNHCQHRGNLYHICIFK
jgi:hypothetical protein